MGYPGVRCVEPELVSCALPDVAAATGEAMRGAEGLAEHVRGKRIAVGVGSRGIANYGTIVRAILDWLKGQGAEPVLVPAMGSHGGATPQGQRQILADVGITAEAMGAELLCSDDWVEVGERDGRRLTMLRAGLEADGVILVNRVKPHTDYDGPMESGLCKMLAIGLSGPEGASQIHGAGHEHMADLIAEHARALLMAGKVVGGVAILEDGLHQTAKVAWLDADRWLDEEPRLLDEAKAMFPTLPFESLDALVVSEIGKNYSGTGFDTNVIGRKHVLTGLAAGPPHIRVIAALDLSAGSHGNALGVGLADVVTERLLESIDWEYTYTNVRTSGSFPLVKRPMALPTDRDVLDFVFQRAALAHPAAPRVAFIPNTLDLSRIYVTDDGDDAEPIPMAGDRLAMWLQITS